MDVFDFIMNGENEKLSNSENWQNGESDEN